MTQRDSVSLPGSIFASNSLERLGTMNYPYGEFVPSGYKLDLIDQVRATPNQNNRAQYMGRFTTETHRYSVIVGLGDPPGHRPCPHLSMIAVQYNLLDDPGESDGFILQGGNNAFNRGIWCHDVFSEQIRERDGEALRACFRILSGIFNMLREWSFLTPENDVLPGKIQEVFQPQQMELILRGLYLDPKKVITAFSPDVFTREDDLGLDRLFSNSEEFDTDPDTVPGVIHPWAQGMEQATLVAIFIHLEWLNSPGILDAGDNEEFNSLIDIIYHCGYDMVALIHQCEKVGIIRPNHKLRGLLGADYDPGDTRAILRRLVLTSSMHPKLKKFRISKSVFTNLADDTDTSVADTFPLGVG